MANLFDTDTIIRATENSRIVDKVSHGHCAKAVRQILEESGFDLKEHPVSAYQYADYLPSLGFSQIASITGNNNLNLWTEENAEIGDIAVIKHGKHGHICIWNGKHWVSDYNQRLLNPYNNNVTASIFRYGNYENEGEYNSGRYNNFELLFLFLNSPESKIPNNAFNKISFFIKKLNNELTEEDDKEENDNEEDNNKENNKETKEKVSKPHESLFSKFFHIYLPVFAKKGTKMIPKALTHGDTKDWGNKVVYADGTVQYVPYTENVGKAIAEYTGTLDNKGIYINDEELVKLGSDGSYITHNLDTDQYIATDKNGLGTRINHDNVALSNVYHDDYTRDIHYNLNPNDTYISTSSAKKINEDLEKNTRNLVFDTALAVTGGIAGELLPGVFKTLPYIYRTSKIRKFLRPLGWGIGKFFDVMDYAFSPYRLPTDVLTFVTRKAPALSKGISYTGKGLNFGYWTNVAVNHASNTVSNTINKFGSKNSENSEENTAMDYVWLPMEGLLVYNAGLNTIGNFAQKRFVPGLINTGLYTLGFTTDKFIKEPMFNNEIEKDKKRIYPYIYFNNGPIGLYNYIKLEKSLNDTMNESNSGLNELLEEYLKNNLEYYNNN